MMGEAKPQMGMMNDGDILGPACCRTPEGRLISGTLVAAQHRLELRDADGEPLSSTFVSWDLVEAVRFGGKTWRVRLRPTPLARLEMHVTLQDQKARQRLKERLIRRCGLHRRWWSGWWTRKGTG